jgi:Family of unknown function (DUF6452)
MRKFIPGSLLVVAVLILFLLSCTPGSCFEETESYLKASFYDNVTSKLTAPDSVTLFGLNRDSLIYNKATGVQVALMPLDASADSCAFILRVDGLTDTIEFEYSTYPHLISKECGYTYYHQIDTVRNYTKHFIKAIYTANTTITNLNVENIRIFY